jgi:oxygen-independent coproporphyrinogen-3 oxidase
VRFYNTDDIREYIRGDGISVSECPALSEEDRRTEFLMLRLRLAEGFSIKEFGELFGEDHLTSKQSLIDRFSSEGLIRIENGRIALTEQGFYLSNSIISELI